MSTKADTEFILSEALLQLKNGDIKVCESCDRYILKDHMHCYVQSNGNISSLCPECDLPEKWYSKPSSSRHKRFYVYLDPITGESWTQWGHPQKGNPFYIEGDKGTYVRYTNKKHKKRKSRH